MHIMNQTERLIAAKGQGHPAQFLKEEIAELREALDKCESERYELSIKLDDAFMDFCALSKRTCQHCKHWHPTDEAKGVCTGGASGMSSDGFYPDADFGCNRFGEKK